MLLEVCHHHRVARKPAETRNSSALRPPLKPLRCLHFIKCSTQKECQIIPYEYFNERAYTFFFVNTCPVWNQLSWKKKNVFQWKKKTDSCYKKQIFYTYSCCWNAEECHLHMRLWNAEKPPVAEKPSLSFFALAPLISFEIWGGGLRKNRQQPCCKKKKMLWYREIYLAVISLISICVHRFGKRWRVTDVCLLRKKKSLAPG